MNNFFFSTDESFSLSEIGISIKFKFFLGVFMSELRKNFYGSKSINGADVTATLYTIIESCKKVELDPRTYILETVKKIINGDEFFTPLETAKQLRLSQ